MFSKARLDTLSDGIFGVAMTLLMTLLILDVRLPEDFHPKDGVSSLLAIAPSFVNSKVALWTLALNFAGPLIRVWSRRAQVSD